MSSTSSVTTTTPAFALAEPKKLRIGLPKWSYPPWTVRHPSTGTFDSGFLPEVYSEMARVGNFQLEYVVMEDDDYFLNITGVNSKMLREKKIDLAWDNNADLLPGFLFTLPMYMNTVTVLVKKTRVEASMWQVFEPFKTELWVAILGSMLFGSTVMLLLNCIYSDTSKSQSFLGYFYHSWAALLGGDEYDLYHLPVFGRLYRLGLLFLVLLLDATYTANLAAYLTRPNFKVHGPSTMEELKTMVVCSRWPAFNGVDQPFINKPIVYPPPGTMPSDALGWARAQLQEGKCDAIIEIDSNAQREALEHCDTMQIHSHLAFAPNSVYNIMRDDDVSLYRNVSSAIATVLRKPIYTDIVGRNFRFGTSCQEGNLLLGSSSGSSTGEESKIGITQMSIVFWVFGVLGIGSVLFTLGQRLVMGEKRGRLWWSRKAIGIPKKEVKNEKLDEKLNLVLVKLDAVLLTRVVDKEALGPTCRELDAVVRGST